MNKCCLIPASLGISTKFSLLNFLSLIYHHSQFLVATSISQLFLKKESFYIGPHLFTASLFLIRYYLFLWISTRLRLTVFNVEGLVQMPVWFFINLYHTSGTNASVFCYYFVLVFWIFIKVWGSMFGLSTC